MHGKAEIEQNSISEIQVIRKKKTVIPKEKKSEIKILPILTHAMAVVYCISERTVHLNMF